MQTCNSEKANLAGSYFKPKIYFKQKIQNE